LFASRIADAVLEGQQMLTEGGATAESPEPAEAGAAGGTSPETETATTADEAVAQPTGEAGATEAAPSSEQNESAEVLAAT
jgi:hypothetical protein